MACAADLSIFSFSGEETRSFPAAAAPRAIAQSAHVFDAAETHPSPSMMLLDLENLTPETLEAFFPSEHALAK